MAYQYTVTDKQKDPNNGNIVVTVTFNDAVTGNTYTRQTWAFDLTNTAIDNWARNVISTLVTRDANFGTITLNVPTTPSPVDPTTQAQINAVNAQVALSQAVTLAQMTTNATQLASTNTNVQAALVAYNTAQSTASSISISTQSALV